MEEDYGELGLIGIVKATRLFLTHMSDKHFVLRDLTVAGRLLVSVSMRVTAMRYQPRFQAVLLGRGQD